MKAILLNTATKKAEEIEIKNYKDIQAQIGCRLFTLGGRLPNGDICYVDDEGLLTNPQMFVKTPAHPNPLAGNMVIVGDDGKGWDAPAKTTVQEATSFAKFLTVDEVRAMLGL